MNQIVSMLKQLGAVVIANPLPDGYIIAGDRYLPFNEFSSYKFPLLFYYNARAS